MWHSEEAFQTWIFNESTFNDLHGSDSSDSDGDGNDAVPPRKPRSRKAFFSVEDRYSSFFYKTYLSETAIAEGIMNDDSWLGKKFRRRFRVPYSVFKEICLDIDLVLGERAMHDRAGHETVPVSLLVLGSLRVIGSGCTFDAIEELTNVAEETHRIFFHEQFCNWGERVSPTHIKMPCDAESLRHVLGLYERLGHPGCTGSIDCVHVIWDKCPAGLKSACKGKGGFPTLAFQVVCSHTKKIMSVSVFFWGTVNDKTIAMADDVFRKLQDDDAPLRNIVWHTIKTKDAMNDNDTLTVESNDNYPIINRHYTIVSSTLTDIVIQFKGAYLISDGGYHRWGCLVNPYHLQPPGTDLELWSNNIESVRKDIECVFGILKKRFLILKHPIRLHSPYCIQRMFVTCCVLHNILLDYDGYDKWNEDNVENSVEYNVLEESAERRAQQSRNREAVSGVRSANREMYGGQGDRDDDNDVCGYAPDEEEAYHARRFNLVKHLMRMRQMRLVHIGR